MIKEEKCGITYYFGADTLACCDMDINPGLTTVQIWHNINMPDTDKVFPDVKELKIIEWRVKPRPIRLHINKTYAVCCPSDVSAGFIFSSYICPSSRIYVYDTLYAVSPHIL